MEFKPVGGVYKYIRLKLKKLIHSNVKCYCVEEIN